MHLEKVFNCQFKQVMKRYHALVSEHNTLQVHTKSTQLREPHQSKFKTLTSFYLRTFWNDLNSPLWANTHEIPTLFITRRDLANLCNCSMRAVQDHLARLSTFGLIYVNELPTSSQNFGYQIRINLWLLFKWEECKPTLRSWLQKPTMIKKVNFSEVWQTLPDLRNLETLNNSYKENSEENVDCRPQERHQEIFYQEMREMAQNSSECPEEDQEIDQENRVAPGESPVDKHSEKQGRFEAYLQGNLHKTRYQTINVQKSNGITNTEKELIVNNFWNFTKGIFYPHANYKPIDLQIKHVIQKHVFNDFTTLKSEENTFVFWQTYSLKLQYWAEKKHNYDTKKDRVAYHPIQYFSKEYGNSKRQGFLVVNEWAKRAEKSLRELAFEKELFNAQNAVNQYILFKKLPKGQKNKIVNKVQLYQYLCRKLQVRTNQYTTQKFMDFVTNYQFIN